jgi:HEAT repeat protein
MSFLEKDLAGREYAIRKFCSLKDASCDVLLEMIDDHDKGIRIGSLIGLGDIGSAIAAKSLIVAIEKTSGELKEVAIRQIFKIKDIAAVPDLINILDDSPVDSLTFEAALTALTENLSSLHVWENEGKIKEYINIPSAKFKVKIQSILADKDGRRKAGVELIIKNCLTLRGSDLALKYNLTKKLCKLTVEELLICIGNENLIVVHIAFKLLCSNGQAKSAIEGILQSLQSGRVLGEKIKFSNADYKKMKPVFVNIIKSNDEDYLRIALSFLQKHPVPEMEETILQAT